MAAWRRPWDKNFASEAMTLCKSKCVVTICLAYAIYGGLGEERPGAARDEEVGGSPCSSKGCLPEDAAVESWKYPPDSQPRFQAPFHPRGLDTKWNFLK